MGLRTRLILLILLAALAPLALLGIVANHVSTTRLIDKVTEVQARTASSLADFTASWVDLQLELLARQVVTFDVATLSDAKLTGLLQLVYNQTPGAQIAILVDAGGEPLTPMVYRREGDPLGVKGRQLIDDEQLDVYVEQFEAVRVVTPPGRIDLSRPYRPTDDRGPVSAVVARLAGGAALGVELDLGPLVSRFTQAEDSLERVVLLDEEGEVIAGDASLVDRSAIAALPVGSLVDDLQYRTPDGVEVLAASAAVAGTGWRVVVTEPMSSTLAPAREISEQTAYVASVAGVLSVLLGLLVGRQITGPVLGLRDAALAVAEGDFGRRVDGQEGSGELTELTHAFNFMSRRLQQDRDVIAAKNDEIEAFNRELQDRVEERTRQLREAQGQLVRSARLAAVGEMGAGLAHELNNPLAGILGLSQVLVAKAGVGPDADMLRNIEEQARRCSEIVRQLQGFAASAEDEGPVDPRSRPVVDLGGVVDEVLGLVRASFRDRGVELGSELADGLDVRGDRGALGQAFAQLFTSLRSAAPPGARLHVTGQLLDRELVIGLDLSGGALRVGEDDWKASGMGFWAARKVLAAHGGTLDEPDLPVGKPVHQARWHVRLPRA